MVKRALTTPRILLAVPDDGDAELLMGYHRENREHLQPWEPERPEAHYRSSAYWRRRLEGNLRDHQAGRAYHFILIDPLGGEMMGAVSFSNVVRGPFCAAHLGYSLAEKRQGAGLMFEALSALIPHIFETAGLHRIMANYMPENLKSGNLLQRLGFEREGYARAYLYIAGQWRDHVLTSRINESGDTD